MIVFYFSMCAVCLFVLLLLFRWAYLEITTNASHSDDDQAYTAGLGEALLTSDLIKFYWHNTLDGYCTTPLSPYCQRLKKFVDTNAAWMQQQLDSKGNVDPYWHQVASLIVSLSLLLLLTTDRLHCVRNFVHKCTNQINCCMSHLDVNQLLVNWLPFMEWEISFEFG